MNSVLEFRPDILNHYLLVLKIDHDEYWSAAMRDHLEALIPDGGDVILLSGNNVVWQVRREDSSRTLVCQAVTYKEDPVYETGDHRQLSTA